MLLHDQPFVAAELSGLLENRIRNADFAHIMHWSSIEYQICFGLGHPHFECQNPRVVAHAHDMEPGIVILEFCSLPKATNHIDTGFAQLGGSFPDLSLQFFVLIGQSQVCADSGKYSQRSERLGDVVHCPGLESSGLILSLIHGGDEDDRNVSGSGVGLESPAHLEAVNIRHHDVQQDEVGRGRGSGDLKCPEPVDRSLHFVAGVQHSS